MLTLVNKVDVESTFNARSPKPFVDRVEVYENIDETSPSTKSTLQVSINTHINDISLGNDEFALLDNQYLLENLYINFLLVKSANYEDFTTDDFFKLSNVWQYNNLIPFSVPATTGMLVPRQKNFSKFTTKLADFFNFDINEDREELSKSLRFEDSDSDIYVLPLQTVDLDIPLVYSEEKQIFDQNVYLFVYISPDERELGDFDSLSLKEKNYLNSFFSGVNYVEIIKDQQINDQKLSYYDEAAGAYWQTDVIKDSNDRVFGAQTFSAREILTKYYEFVLNKEREVSPSERVRMRDFFVKLKTPFFSTKPNEDCLVQLKPKVESLIEDYADKFEELTVVNSVLKFINGVDQQLSLLPVLQSRLVGDIRIQRQTLNFLEGIEVGRSTFALNSIQGNAASDSTAGGRKNTIFSDFFYASDDDGSVEIYFLVNKTNLMKYRSDIILRFPNLRKYIPEIDSFFSLKTVEVFRGHRLLRDEQDFFHSIPSEDINTLIGTYEFNADSRISGRKNQNVSFFGNFVGKREVLQLVQTDETTVTTSTTLTEGVDDSDEAVESGEQVDESTTRTVSETVTSKIDVSTNGFATALANFDPSGDEIIVFCLNDQSINASDQDMTTGDRFSILQVPSITSAVEVGSYVPMAGSGVVQEETEEVIDDFENPTGTSGLALAYKAVFTAVDNISSPIVSLYRNLEKTIEDLEEYERIASQKCSFNDIAFKFNDFFIDQQYREYPELRLAPWNLIPSALVTHATLFNKNIINQNEIEFNASQIKKKLDPKSASLYSINLVLSAARTMRNDIRQKLIDLGIANVISTSVSGEVLTPSVHNIPEFEHPVGSVLERDAFYAKLSQYDGDVQLVETEVQVQGESVFEPPSLGVLVGQFVTKLKPAINKLYRDLNTNQTPGNFSFESALSELAYYVIQRRARGADNNSSGFPFKEYGGMSTDLDGVGQMKLNLIMPYRNVIGVDEAFGWRNNIIDVRGRFEALEQEGVSLAEGATTKYTIDFANLGDGVPNNSQTKRFNNENVAAQSVNRLTFVALTQENILGRIGPLPTGEIIYDTRQAGDTALYDQNIQYPEYKMFKLSEFSSFRLVDKDMSPSLFRNQGFGKGNQHIVFMHKDNEFAHKASHDDYNEDKSRGGGQDKQETRKFLNKEIFKGSKSGVRDRNTLYDSGYSVFTGESSAYLPSRALAHFYEAYMVAFAEVFSEIDFRDGDGFLDTTKSFVNGNENDHLFVRLYRSGFYPWPGFPELPDEIGEGINAFFGGQ